MHASFTPPFSDSPNPDFAITAYGLEKTYGGEAKGAGKQALKSIDIEVPRGCIFGLLGPNGAGKSTFINILAGTVIKSAGSVSVWGSDLDTAPRQLRANIGIVPQELNIDVYFTPRELLEFNAGMYGVPKAERRTDALLALMGLTDKAGAYSRTLSGGMRRRLLVAKAMVHQPPVLVLDEPTAGVDVELRRTLWAFTRELHAAGHTIVLTTHYLEEAEALCERIAIMDRGELRALERTDDFLKRHPFRFLRLSIDGPGSLPQGIESLVCERQGPELELRLTRGQDSVADVLDGLRDAGFRVTDVHTREPSLEDIFVELTGDQND